MRKKKFLFVYIAVIFSLILIVATIFLFFQPMKIIGNSMYPTYKENDIVFVNTAETNFSTNDVIVFYYGHAKVVKRVCATSGDFVEVRDDGVYINGRIIAVNNESYEIMQRTLESREYFVLGDNYAYSTDSRYFGVITSEQCIGRIVCSINFNH